MKSAYSNAERDRAAKESKKLKMSSESRITRKKVRKDAKISRKRREERERDKEKAYVKRPISSEEQREKEIQRAPENKLKRGHEQREVNHKGSEKEKKVNRVSSGFSPTLRPRKIQTFSPNLRLILASVYNLNHVSVKQ